MKVGERVTVTLPDETAHSGTVTEAFYPSDRRCTFWMKMDDGKQVGPITLTIDDEPDRQRLATTNDPAAWNELVAAKFKDAPTVTLDCEWGAP